MTREYEEKLSRAQQEADKGLADADEQAQIKLDNSRQAEQRIAEQLKTAQRDKQELSAELNRVQAMLEKVENRLNIAKGEISNANSKLAQQRSSTQEVENKVSDLQDKLAKQTRLCNQAQDSVATEKAAHLETRRQLIENQGKSTRLEAELRLRADAVTDLQQEKAAHARTRSDLGILSTRVKHLETQAEQNAQAWENSIKGVQEAHDKTKAVLADEERKTANAARKAREAEGRLRQVEKLKQTSDSHKDTTISSLSSELTAQREAAVSSMQYCMSSLGLASEAVSPEELTSVHANCKPSSAPADDTRRLPPIVIAAGHLPVAWSYVSLASAGFTMNNRFNRIIRPTVSTELPWVVDTLDRVLKIVASAESVPADVLLVLLQGIAWVYEASTMATAVELTPKLKKMLEPLMKHASVNPGSVLQVVYRRVAVLVRREDPITSWFLGDDLKEMRVDSSNSALPKEINLVYSHSFLYLVRSNLDTNVEELFVFDERAVRWRLPRMGYGYLQLPPTDGLDVLRLELMTEDAHMGIARWVSSIGLIVD